MKKSNSLDKVEKTVLVIAVLLIPITIGLGVFKNSTQEKKPYVSVRKEEIGIMKYIGATDAFVRLPFVLEGVVLGIIGAAIPLVGLFFVYNSTVQYIFTKFNVLTVIVDFIPVMEIYRTLLPIGLALGIGIGLVGSFLTTRKHLKV